MIRIAPIAALLFVVAGTALAQNLMLVPIATGLNQPLGITQAGDSRLFIVQQIGTVVIYNGTSILPTPFLDLRSLVLCCGERGLLGLAFHPHYRDNGRFFVYYTNRNGDIVIARYSVSSDPDRGDPATATILLTIPHPTFANHNGGQLQFGPDGYLYAGIGDGGSAGDPNNHGQDLSQLLGKLLRIDVDHGSPYAVPSSNPFVQRAGARGEIWAYGLRNPWRFSFDRENGDLWIGDVGQDKYEEIDLQPAASIGGEDYGWRRMEGFHCFNPSTNCSDPSFTPPVLEYNHSVGCSITGGYRYRGMQMSSIRGAYVYGDYCSGSIWGATQNVNGTWLSIKLLTTTLAISSFGEDLSGELYVADVAKGIVYRMTEKIPPRRRAVAK